MAGAHLKAKMSLDAKGVKAGTKQAKGAVSGFSKQLKAIGPQMAAAFSVGAITAFTKKVIDYGSQISDLAYQTGLSTDELQAFQVAVTNAGGTVEQAGKALLGLRDAQDAALNGEKMYSDAFDRLGITMEDLAGKSMPQLLESVAANYSELQDFGSLVDLFGKRNAGKLEEALISLAENGFDPIIEKYKELGYLMSQEDLLALDALSDRMERFGIRMKTVWGGILNHVANAGRVAANYLAAQVISLQKLVSGAAENIKNIMTFKWGKVTSGVTVVKEAAQAGATAFSDMQEFDREEDAANEKRVKDQEKERKARQEAARDKKQAAVEAAAVEEESAQKVIDAKRAAQSERLFLQAKGDQAAIQILDMEVHVAELKRRLSEAATESEKAHLKEVIAIEEKKLAAAQKVYKTLSNAGKKAGMQIETGADKAAKKLVDAGKAAGDEMAKGAETAAKKAQRSPSYGIRAKGASGLYFDPDASVPASVQLEIAEKKLAETKRKRPTQLLGRGHYAAANRQKMKSVSDYEEFISWMRHAMDESKVALNGNMEEFRRFQIKISGSGITEAVQLGKPEQAALKQSNMLSEQTALLKQIRDATLARTI